MSRTSVSIAQKMKNSTCPNDFSIVDAENFEPPQQSSTPAKTNSRKSKRILKDNTNLNISVIGKQDQDKKVDVETDDQQYKSLLPSVIEENYEYDRVPELFCSDPEDDKIEDFSKFENKTVTVINDSDDKWTTFSDVSEDKSAPNATDILAEIDADVQVRFEKPSRRSYPGRKRSNISLFEDKEEEEVEVKVPKKDKKSKQKKKINPQEEAFIQSINDHFNDVESFSLIVE